MSCIKHGEHLKILCRHFEITKETLPIRLEDDVQTISKISKPTVCKMVALQKHRMLFPKSLDI